MFKEGLKKILAKLGYQVGKISTLRASLGQEPGFLSALEGCEAFTLTTLERLFALHQAVQYVVSRGIPGDFVECGVWKGGSAMLMAKTLMSLNASERQLYLYDTYEGMPEPEKADVAYDGVVAAEEWKRHRDKGQSLYEARLEEVKTNLASTGFPEKNLHFVKGKVEDSIPGTCPGAIALLRLDTDWQASTRHEMEHLYPRLSQGGVLILDDYGHWQGARLAVDEYLKAKGEKLLLNRIDMSARMAVKP